MISTIYNPDIYDPMQNCLVDLLELGQKWWTPNTTDPFHVRLIGPSDKSKQPINL